MPELPTPKPNPSLERIFDLACRISDKLDDQRSDLAAELLTEAEREGLTREQLDHIYKLVPESPHVLTIYASLLAALEPSALPPAWVQGVMRAEPDLHIFAPTNPLHTPGSIWRVEYGPCGQFGFWFGQIPYCRDWVCGYDEKHCAGGDSARLVLVEFSIMLGQLYAEKTAPKGGRYPSDRPINNEVAFADYSKSVACLAKLYEAAPEDQ